MRRLPMSTTSVRSVRTQTDSAAAFNLAESGAELGMLWLRMRDSPPMGTATRTVYSNVRLGAGTYTVSIDPDDQNPMLELPSYPKCSWLGDGVCPFSGVNVSKLKLPDVPVADDNRWAALDGLKPVQEVKKKTKRA